ncbi:hypothetical protein [Nonomuraea rhodomycinica]|uniref:Uncharacterized protein n=1 Tax=Nonomuraea rhodomycinica TaxID=1712872 RepID=A0A7Y6IWK4_9ACTN|nr:hypothetical protein [Nonomuraea rhodomycinica]NUW45173.1 hypothetical protein [Nonomuraea rhodomycinica]
MVDVNADGLYVRVEDLNVTTDQDSTPGGDPHEGIEVDIFWEPGQGGWTMAGLSETLFTLDDVQAVLTERDALRRELAELRAGLCSSLGRHRGESGPRGLTVRPVLSDQEIFAEIERLRTIAPESSA